MLKFNSLMPELRVSNIENSKDFYLKNTNKSNFYCI